MSFTNKVVIVTGSSSGIGAAFALKFAQEGANVVIVGRKVDKLKKVSENIAKVGNKPLVITADVTKDEDCQKIVNETLKRFGKIDVLINNAGVASDAVNITDKNTIELFDRIMATNVRSVVYLTHLASQSLIETKGNIINISSAAAQCAVSNLYAYNTSKAALDHFTRSIAHDFASKGVRVNTISPGPVRTDLLENSGVIGQENVEKGFEAMRQLTALKRVSDPSEMAELAIFLASDKAVGITGSTILADNGYLLTGH